MKDKRLARYLMLAAFAAIPLAAQTNPVFSPRRMKDYNEQSRDGRCVLRVRVDDEIDVELRGNSVLLRTITGRPGKDEGSECSQPLPAGGFTKFNFRGIDGRGEVRLVQEPRLGTTGQRLSPFGTRRAATRAIRSNCRGRRTVRR